ncbi:MAG: DUF262 domain-containing protein [Eubacteriales bacterium]|nr:DUF262 domain-containing protein [Eubacteriales bacterium]
MEKDDNKKNGEDRYGEAVETAHEIDIIEDVMIQTATTQMSFSAIMIGLERGDYVTPRFQRMYRWSEEQVGELAISLVRGMPIPPIYCYRNKEQQIVILDGQQRIISLYLYYIGKCLARKKNAFVDSRFMLESGLSFREFLESCGLKDKTYEMIYKGKNGEDKTVDITYDNLSDRLKRKIDFAPITIVEINVDSKEYRERTLHKIFANLNMGGIPLSSQELRNGIYSCKFYDMLYEINDSSLKWRYLYSGNQHADINKESKDVELLLRRCSFKYFVNKEDGKFTLTGYKGKITTLLDDFSEIVQQFTENQIQEYRESLVAFFDSIESVSSKKRELALVSLFVVWDWMEDKPFISKEKCDEIINSDGYTKTISSGTSGRTEIEERLRSVYEQLSIDSQQNNGINM